MKECGKCYSTMLSLQAVIQMFLSEQPKKFSEQNRCRTDRRGKGAAGQLSLSICTEPGFYCSSGKKSYKEDQSLATFFFSRIIWLVCIIARLIFTHRSFKETATAFPSLGKSLSKAPGSIFALQVKQERQWNAACEKTRFRITEESN